LLYWLQMVGINPPVSEVHTTTAVINAGDRRPSREEAMTKPNRSGLARKAAHLGAALMLSVGLSGLTSAAFAAGKIRVAFGDIASVEALGFLTALERAKERGVDIDITYLKSEDIAAQAVVGGQADVGVGTPYALLQKVRAPIRIFYQMSTLRFYPVVNTEFYKDWSDLNGQEVAVHSRGSGTEAIMNLLAKKNGIRYGQVSYVPGSEVRTGALLQGNVKATIVDSAGCGCCKPRLRASSRCCRSRTSTPVMRRSTPIPIFFKRKRMRSIS
jgi:NitT/TauT family transport system substrate-binding protein